MTFRWQKGIFIAQGLLIDCPGLPVPNSSALCDHKLTTFFYPELGFPVLSMDTGCTIEDSSDTRHTQTYIFLENR